MSGKSAENFMNSSLYAGLPFCLRLWLSEKNKITLKQTAPT